MPSFRLGVVSRVTGERPGLQRVLVVADQCASTGTAAATAPSAGEPAYVLTHLTGTVGVGDRVLYNDTAVRLGLGTGGWHVVHANLSVGDWSEPGDGHVLKLRYTSLQTDVGVAEEHLSELPDTLDGTPVVACTLHSQIAPVAVAARAARAGTRIAYVMTDGGALPLALSDLLASLCERGIVDAGTVTAGHAFGGDLEAVGVPSALALARHRLGADLIVVAMGPGVVGTELPLGTSALEAAPVLDAAAALGGRPVMCVRASSADPRARHRGVSHHPRTVLGLVRSEVDVPVPGELVDELASFSGRHRLIPVEDSPIAALLDDAGLSVTTMGRGPQDDPLFFRAAAAAGTHAASLVPS